MKKLILLLLFIPLVSFGQNRFNLNDWVLEKLGEEEMNSYINSNWDELDSISGGLERFSQKEYYTGINDKYLKIGTGSIYSKQWSLYSSKNGRMMEMERTKTYRTERGKMRFADKDDEGMFIINHYKLYTDRVLRYFKNYNNSSGKSIYNGSRYKEEYYREEILTTEINFKGLESSENTGGFYIPDGFQREYSDKNYDIGNEVCYEKFYIYGNLMYESKRDKCKGIVSVLSDYNNRVNEYDLEAMVNVFLDDYLNNYLDAGLYNEAFVSIPSFFDEFKKLFNINATFTPLEGDALALSYGFNDDKNIVLKVDPEKWAKASSAKRWYTIYHELGHDVLNFEHGQGGKMMFNFADRDYNWETFEKDRNYMFNKAIENAKKRNELF